eukprot:TRINITY_DN730_c0_g2_i1.p1 TRINITY_DN730_c0_g2~~TRINITY_DN730_c0_g2_i1.p1  ORF type:complete len:312 (-),score=58.67 TRINITY_DN730_c0_g2_i1:15-950(-)
MAACRELLKKATVGSLPKPPKVIIIDTKESLYDGFQKLLTNNVLAAPVYNQETKQYCGFLDVRDLVSFVVYLFDDNKVADNNTLKETLVHGVKMFATPTTDGANVSYLSRRNRFLPVTEKDNLLKVTEILSSGVHRVPVVDDHGVVINIVSQSTILRYLHQHLAELGDVVKKTIGELKIGSSPVQAVDKSTTVIDTLRQMDSKKRSGIALVDSEGRLVGTTTGKDLGLFINNPTLLALKKPIFSFLNEVRAQLIDIRSPTIAVFGTDSLAMAIGKLSATKVHRIFVVNNEVEYKAQSVISITDIFKFFISQ